ncbi:G-protein coupled receptor family C group 6 member A [Merluccius polli]|uniref:G-protein coupled receptor family C group 6 member A n=1 Tax=Merluccius polli TaxID=89951 RepID=A0AA47MHL3_MERPO|nr:G-protein coupled receptor family C group 6 member A [Merluccius polli]
MSPQSCMLLAVLLLGTALSQVGCCDFGGSVCGARMEADIMLGILAPVHSSMHLDRWPSTCHGFNIYHFLFSLEMIHTIEEVNAAGLLPGLSLGYYMCDTCSNSRKALQNLEHMMAINGSLDVRCNQETVLPRIKAFLGGVHSEVSIAVAKLLSVHLVPQVSSASSSPALSNKLRYPAFLRTVPSDVHQTKAMARLIAHYNWNWVGVVYEEDDYGIGAFQSFHREATEIDVCLAYQEMVPHHPELVMERIQQIAQRIRNTPKAQVVVLILKFNSVQELLREMIRTNTSRTWIASDSWSKNLLLAEMEGIEKVSESFDSWLQKLRPPPGPGSYNRFIQEYKNLRFNCTPECFSDHPPSHCSEVDLKLKSPKACDYDDPQEADDDFLVTALDTSAVYSARLAVWAVAHALRRLLGCNGTSCSGETDLKPWMLLEQLKNITFELNNTTYSFDPSGDFLDGYDVQTWVMGGAKTVFRKIGRYYATNGSIVLNENQIVWYSGIPTSRCSPTCPPGTIKKILDQFCCYNCTDCQEGTFTNSSDLSVCYNCTAGNWSLKAATKCTARTEVFLHWRGAHSIIIVAAALAGLLLLVVVFVVFMVHRDSQPMKRAEVRLSCVMMVGLAASFTSVLFFIGKPNEHLCRTRQVLYAMGFTLCVACILVKAFRTFLVFLPFGPLRNRRLYKLYKPPAVVFVVTALQGVICILYLVLDSPEPFKPEPSSENMLQLIQCRERSKIGFGVMLGYIALLALGGFLLAFKGRKVPQEFSETGYIIFSMLMYLFVWVCFTPLYILKTELSSRIQSSAILVSSYGIVFCHFLPKCYEALWGLNGDTLEKIIRKWRNMYPGREAGAASTVVDAENGGDRPPHAVVRAGTVGPYRPSGSEEFKTPKIIINKNDDDDAVPVGGPLKLIPRRRRMRCMSL